MLIGYARVSTRIKQDTEHQERALRDLGIPQERIYLDRGFTGKNTNRPGLTLALGVLREGDTLVVTKLDRLARSVVDAHDIAQRVTSKGARLSFNGSTYDPADPVTKMVFGMLAVVAEFERDLISMRTREGLVTARLKGNLNGRPPKLTPVQERALVAMVAADTHTLTEVAAIFGVGRSTVGRALDRAGFTRSGRSSTSLVVA